MAFHRRGDRQMAEALKAEDLAPCGFATGWPMR
jgi:hypothetical protein